MGRNNKKKTSKKKQRSKRTSASNSQSQSSSSVAATNFVNSAGPGCYIIRQDLRPQPPWFIEWEAVDVDDFADCLDEIPDIAIDADQHTLTVCNIQTETTQISYVTVYDAQIVGADGQSLPQGTTITNDGEQSSCVTFIVLSPPQTFAHLCYVYHEAELRIESDVRAWSQHPNPNDLHAHPLGFPLQDGPFLCTQGENGMLTHFFSGNLHAIDFACPVGTPLLAVADAIVVEAQDGNTLTGIAVTNLFQWNSVMLQIQTKGKDEGSNDDDNGDLFVEYVHIQKSHVKVGDRVSKGDIVALSGSVGFSPEPHLHFSAFRTSQTDAPTVRVRFAPRPEVDADNAEGKARQPQRHATFLPQAGRWYDASGEVSRPRS